jgi:hypothetical protein
MTVESERIVVRNLTQVLIGVSGQIADISGERRWFEIELPAGVQIGLLSLSQREGMRLILAGDVIGSVSVVNESDDTIVLHGVVLDAATAQGLPIHREIKPMETVRLLRDVGADRRSPPMNAWFLKD